MKLTTFRCLILLVLLIGIGPVLSSAEPGDSEIVQTTPVPVRPVVALDQAEIAALHDLHVADVADLQDQVGGADKDFWRAAAIGAGAIILLIIIF